MAKGAEAASGTFELTAENQASVADLCRRLDGLPLAIELAAVRTRVLSVQQILERLADRFALLSGGGRAALPRHQTLETAIDWSHDLLTAEERTLLRRLCVFAGRFTLEDVAAVCMLPSLPPPRALDLTSSLVEKSLVVSEGADATDYVSIRRYLIDYHILDREDSGQYWLLNAWTVPADSWSAWSPIPKASGS